MYDVIGSACSVISRSHPDLVSSQKVKLELCYRDS